MSTSAEANRVRPAGARATTPTLVDTELADPSALARTEAPERSLGRYRILRELGRGGMGVVLEAYDPTLDRRVALKILSTDLGERLATRQLREAQALARLSHPNVVGVYEVGTVHDQSFIAMELVEGRSLRQWHRAPRPWPEVLDAYLQAGSGLAAAHAQGLVHRDFKPANCLIDATGRVRVADFGLAGDVVELRRSSDADATSAPTPSPSNPFEARITRAGAVLGTPAYMSPEQRLGGACDARSDQYSFCISVSEALYGEDVLPTHAAPLPSISTLPLAPAPRRVPRALRRALARGMSPAPEQRWPSMLALLRELERCRRAGRRRWWGLALLGTNLGLGAVLWTRGDAIEPPCRRAREHMRGVWDEDRALAVDAAIRSTGLSYAEDTRATVRARLDHYADAWVEMHTSTCEAAHVHAELSLVGLDQRMLCLDGRRLALEHAVEQLLEADATVVEQAVRVVSRLPALSHCADARGLQADPLAPAEIAGDVAALRVALDRARTRLQAGKYEAGLRQAEATMHQAETLGYEPVVAEAALIRGQLYQALGRYEEAALDLRAAQVAALRNDHAEIAAEASASLTFVEGVPLAREESALLHGESALAMAQRVDTGGPREAEALLALSQVLAKHGDDVEAEARFTRALELLRARPDADPLDMVGALDGLSGVSRRQGHHAAADRYAREALTLVEQQLGPEHPAVVNRLANLAAVLIDQGHHAAAEQELRRALEVSERALAPDHPTLAHVHGNLGAVLLYRGRHDEATLELEHALERWQHAPSPQPDMVADVLANLGVAARGRGRADQAEQYYRRALAQYAEVYEASHPKVAMVELNLGKALQALHREPEAMVELERARAAFESYGGPEHPDVGKALDALGLLDYQQERYAAALERQQRALEILERAYPAEAAHPRVARALWALGRTELQLDRVDRARAHLEQALEMQQGSDVRPVDRAQTELTLAELWWQEADERADERADARALARRALARLEHQPGNAAERVRGEAQRWLLAHR